MLYLLGLLALALSWVIPNHYPPWWSFFSEGLAWLALSLLLLSCWRPFRTPEVLGTPVSAVVLAGVAFLPIAQFGLGQLKFFSDAAVAAIYLLAWSTAVWVGRAGARRLGDAFLESLGIAVLVSAVCSAFLALAQSLQVTGLGYWSLDILPGDRAGANLGQANNLATLLAWGFLSLWYLFERARISRVLLALLSAVLLLGLATTQSRTALLYGPAVILGHWLAGRRGLIFRLGLRSVCAVTLLSWLVVAIWPLVLDAMYVTGDLASLKTRGISSQRWPMWHMLLDAAMQKPWSGYGWLQVGAAQLAVADVHPAVDELWMQGHNLFLELVVWCGLPLGLLLSGMVLYWWIGKARSVSTLPSVMAFLAITCFGIHAMLELPHHFLYFLVPVGFFMGQVEADVPNRRQGVSGLWLMLPVAAGALVLGVLVAKDYLKVEEDYRLMRFESMGVRDVPTEQLAPDAPYLDGLTAYLTFTRQWEHAGMSDAELRAWTNLVARYPQPSAVSKLARALALNGRVGEAGVLMIKLRHMHGEREFNRRLSHLESQMSAGHTELRPLWLELQRPPSPASTP